MGMRNMRQSETTEQIKLFDWARRNEQYIPELKLLYHIPNEGKRSNGGILTAMGLKKGMPDICLPVPIGKYGALYIELKYGKNKPSAVQKETMARLEEQGNLVKVAYSAQEAREYIRNYLSRAPGFNLVNCEDAPKISDRCRGIKHDLAPCKRCDLYAGGEQK